MIQVSIGIWLARPKHIIPINIAITAKCHYVSCADTVLVISIRIGTVFGQYHTESNETRRFTSSNTVFNSIHQSWGKYEPLQKLERRKGEASIGVPVATNKSDIRVKETKMHPYPIIVFVLVLDPMRIQVQPPMVEDISMYTWRSQFQ